MRLTIPMIPVEIELKENYAVDVSIENAAMLSGIIQDFLNQKNGESGEIAIIESGSSISIEKNLEIVLNPFEVDCNEKKIINKLYGEIEKEITDSMIEDYSEMNSQLITFLDKAIAKLPYNIETKLDLDIKSLLKVYDVKIDVDQDSLISKLIDYIRISASILNIRIILFVNIKSFLSRDEYIQLCDFCKYNKIQVVNIEGICPYKIDFEQVYIVDSDLCLIC